MGIYRDYDLATLEVQYDIAATVPDLEAVRTGFEAESARVAAARPCRLDVPYGSDPLQTLDIFPADAPGGPIAVYVHGGYWARGDKAGMRFAAEIFGPMGVNWVTINYRLAPPNSLDDIVADVRDAVGWVHAHAGEIGGDPDRIYAIGNSAGGHLTAMLAAPGWPAEHGLPGDAIKGACAISGLHDLRPFLHTSQKSYLHLDDAAVGRLSPMQHLPKPGFPLIVAWGGKETDEFARQSHDYAEACRDAGVALQSFHFPEHDHFSMQQEFAKRDGRLTTALLAMMGV